MTVEEQIDVLESVEKQLERIEYSPADRLTKVDYENYTKLQSIHYQLCKEWNIKRGINT